MAKYGCEMNSGQVSQYFPPTPLLSSVKEMYVYYLQLGCANMVTLASSTAPRIILKYKKFGRFPFPTATSHTSILRRPTTGTKDQPPKSDTQQVASPGWGENKMG